MAWKTQNAKFSMEDWRGGYGSSHTLRAFLIHDTTTPAAYPAQAHRHTTQSWKAWPQRCFQQRHFGGIARRPGSEPARPPLVDVTQSNDLRGNQTSRQRWERATGRLTLTCTCTCALALLTSIALANGRKELGCRWKDFSRDSTRERMGPLHVLRVSVSLSLFADLFGTHWAVIIPSFPICISCLAFCHLCTSSILLSSSFVSSPLPPPLPPRSCIRTDHLRLRDILPPRPQFTTHTVALSVYQAQCSLPSGPPSTHADNRQTSHLACHRMLALATLGRLLTTMGPSAGTIICPSCTSTKLLSAGAILVQTTNLDHRPVVTRQAQSLYSPPLNPRPRPWRSRLLWKLSDAKVAKDGHIEIPNSLLFRPHFQPVVPTLVSLRPTRAAVVSPSGPPSVTFASTAPDRQTIRERLAHCFNCPPPLEPGCISGGTQDLSDERLAKQPVSNSVPYGYNVFFNSLMHHTRLLESIKWPKQRSKEENMFLSTQLHDSLHPLSMHACIPRRNSKKNSSTAPGISWHTYWNVYLLFLLLMLDLDPTPPEPIIPPQANQNTADLPEPWFDQPLCSTLAQTIHIRSSLPDSFLGFPSVFVFNNA
ncbi:uncharacterized protein CLUP02_05204 [Colletotrichum lupini]|uniref:Uncharacterized protein n=1 Tax=Colletotrichum lupini TaxID=145971 RepID=A0A9Q8SLS9_9PEZI|nr:uncharacterized protein CLUP02_05204 [Colletotrichum lupini]UQC79724.1 hypothetical protein CLUP02_05204 [Colletotrichum lupini]